jgi:hypothetical protein
MSAGTQQNIADTAQQARLAAQSVIREKQNWYIHLCYSRKVKLNDVVEYYT